MLLEKIVKLFGEDIFTDIPKSIRVNTIKIEEKRLVERLKEKGFILEKIPWTMYGYWIIEAPYSIGATTEYLLGYYTIQDPASMFACEVLDPKPNDLVLDMCAAPGGKTSYIAQLMGNKGVIIAFDINRDRMRALRSNITRLGVENVIAIRRDVLKVKELGLEFDKILLDAPCTGTGVAFRDKKALEKSDEEIKKLSNLQKKLIEAGYSVLRKGGVMVYSTCSILPEENEMVVDYALKNFNLDVLEIEYGDESFTEVYGLKLDERIKKAKRFYPKKHKSQGFFITKFVKI